jgi:hypothetical protein
MPYSLPDDIEKIRYFNKGADSYFAVVPQLVAPWLGTTSVAQGSVAAALNQLTPSFRLILRKTVPIMLCIAWETFVEELKTADNARYAANFPTGFELYHNEDIREVFLLRNCIIHCAGKIDAEYLRKSLIKTFTVVGTAIDFTEVQLDTQFKLFGDAYSQITT